MIPRRNARPFTARSGRVRIQAFPVFDKATNAMKRTLLIGPPEADRLLKQGERRVRLI